jgi:hypothetical protein
VRTLEVAGPGVEPGDASLAQELEQELVRGQCAVAAVAAAVGLVPGVVVGGGAGDNLGKGGLVGDVPVGADVEQGFDAYAWAVAIAAIVPDVTAAQLVQLLGLVLLKGRVEQGEAPPWGLS